MNWQSEREQSFYAELFQSCDSEGSGRISWAQAAELFRSTRLSQDILVQVSELCGAKRLGHFGRSQFYIALKLIAAAQCGLPVTHESINSGKEIPLPVFQRDESRVQQPILSGGDMQGVAERQQQQGQLPPPPKKSHGRNLSGQYRGIATDGPPVQSFPPQQTPIKERPTAETISPPFSPAQGAISVQASIPVTVASLPLSPPTSPQTQQMPPKFSTPSSPPTVVSSSHQVQGHVNLTGSNAPAENGPRLVLPEAANINGPPTSQQSTVPGPGSPQEESLLHLDKTNKWEDFNSDEEKKGLLGSGPKREWEGLVIPEIDSSSDQESVDDVWSINDEQREYYVKQFQNIEPDINGQIMGNVAKDFFEKSKLSNQELSKIWQLSDLNQDGALNLEEFCIAMHLVVLRRNEIEIPDRLPFALMPYDAFTNEEPFAADLPHGSTLKRSSPPLSPTAQTAQLEKFLKQESPQISSSELSSPSVTPANFDFQRPQSNDPEAHIIHPKPMRMSPDMIDDVPDGRPERGRAFSEPMPAGVGTDLHDSESPQPQITKQRANTAVQPDQNHIEITKASLQSRPRPSVKNPSVPGALPGHILPPLVPTTSQSHLLGQSISIDSTMEPPAPPPRPPQHYRSFSVDYKAPPAVPPRVTDKDINSYFGKKEARFAQLKQFEPIQSQEELHIIPGSNATTTVNGIDIASYRNKERNKKETEKTEVAESSIEKKNPLEDFIPDPFDDDPERQAEYVLAAQRQANRDKKELQMAVRTHKERNLTLERLNSELNQELQEVMEQRIALEIQLGHLRPFSS